MDTAPLSLKHGYDKLEQHGYDTLAEHEYDALVVWIVGSPKLTVGDVRYA